MRNFRDAFLYMDYEKLTTTLYNDDRANDDRDNGLRELCAAVFALFPLRRVVERPGDGGTIGVAHYALAWADVQLGPFRRRPTDV